MKKNNFLLFLIFLFAFISCNETASKVFKNEKIDNELKEKIHDINQRVYDDFFDRDLTYTKSIAWEAQLPVIESFEELVKRRPITQKSKIEYFDEFYLPNSNPEEVTYLTSNINGLEYTITLSPLGSKTYVSLFSIPDESGENDRLVRMTYDIANSEITLVTFSLEYLTYYGATPFDMLGMAKEKYNRKDLFGAYFLIKQIESIVISADINLKNDWEKHFLSFGSKVLKEMSLKHPLPSIIESIPSKPQIIGSTLKIRGAQPYLVVNYISNLVYVDSVTPALIKENKMVHERINDVFPNATSVSPITIYTITDSLKGRGIIYHLEQKN